MDASGQKLGVNYCRSLPSAEGAKRSRFESRDAAILLSTARLKACSFGATVKTNLSSLACRMTPSSALSLDCLWWAGTKPPHPVASLQVDMCCCTRQAYHAAQAMTAEDPAVEKIIFQTLVLRGLRNESFSLGTTTEHACLSRWQGAAPSSLRVQKDRRGQQLRSPVSPVIKHRWPFHLKPLV